MEEVTPHTLPHRPTVLVILDGFGVANHSPANAISEAKTPNFDHIIATYPTLTLQASGEATGLPWGESGNSEVGHMNIGAGRIVSQELTRINQEISNGRFFENLAFVDSITYAKEHNSRLHLLGIVSSGGVHSHIDHCFALLELCKQKEFTNVAIHVILDGRDAPYASGLAYIEKLEAKMLELGVGQIASISGRFYAMDRDNHWDREEKAYRAIVEGKSERLFDSATKAIDEGYHNSMYDEEFVPTVITKKNKPLAPFASNDAVIFFNFRADRARQLTQALSVPEFSRFERTSIEGLHIVTMTQYESKTPVVVAYPPIATPDSLGEVISKQGLTQLHIAETEKYAHITYFLNNGKEQPLLGETRILVPSPSVESYAEKPEMSAREIADTVAKKIQNEEFDFYAVNFANADMVGHTGKLKETIRAIETLDQCIGIIMKAVLAKNGALVITADHGNAERMYDLQTGEIDKNHTNNPVPLMIIAKDLEGHSVGSVDIPGNDLSVLEPSGILSDVAPTVLALMDIPKAPEMTGSDLLNLS